MSKIIQYSKEFKQKIIETPELSPSKDKSKYRIITKNLVYIIGLSESIADKDILMKYEYLGQYGKILKIIINKKNAYNQGNLSELILHLVIQVKLQLQFFQLIKLSLIIILLELTLELQNIVNII